MNIPTAASGVASDRSKPGQQALVYLSLLGLLLTAGATTATSQPATDLFEQHEIVLATAEHPTVLAGFILDGDIADLAVATIDENGNRRLVIYAFDDATWAPKLETTLRPGVLFVDLASISGRDRLISYEPGRLNWFDPTSATEQALVEISASYRATDEVQIPHVDITRDLNGDGRDDLVVPDVDGFWISTQLDNGSFTDFLKLGPSEPFAQVPIGNLDVGEPASDHPQTYGELGVTAMTIPVYLSRVHQMDYNQDGYTDLVFWNEDHFDVHLQDSGRQFSRTAEIFDPEIPLDSDGTYSRAFEYSDQGMLSLLFGFGKKTERRVLHSLRDLNDDGVTDLVILTLGGRSITSQQSLYEVYFGNATPHGTAFSPDVSATLRPHGKAGGMQPWGYASQTFQDFDGDGQVDVMFRDVNVGIGGMARTLTGNSVPINLEFYRIEEGTIPDKPTEKRKIRRFAPFDGLGNIFFPSVLMGDVNGDGRSDLIVGHGPKELQIYLGVPGPDLFVRQPQKVATSLPYDERNIWLTDINQDGKQDVLMHLAPSEPDRLTILIAQH